MNGFKAFIAVFVFLPLVIMSCSDDKAYTIVGDINIARLEGNKIFLVPMDSTVRVRHGVDSAIIKDGKFSFTGSEEFLARIVLDYRVRYGVQELLVVTEPGVTNVIIDSVSEGHGTPQNDALQRWKVAKEAFDHDRNTFIKLIRKLRYEGDTVRANALMDSVAMNTEMFRKYSLSIANSVEGTTAGDFIYKLYN